jgi:hypothetical protein
MHKILLPAAAALSLVAFAATTQSADLTVETAQPVAWHLSHDGEVAKLAYGASNSDHLALMVTCAAGAPDVAVYGDVRPIAVSMRPVSGPSMPDPLSGGDASEAIVPLADAGLSDLSSKGRMTVKSDERTFQLAATQQERRVVDRFLAYCETGQA